MSELKRIYKTNKKESFVKKIEEKLNVVIEKEDSDFMDFTNATDHDYNLPYVVDCLMYYITGQICQNLKKRNCMDCKSAIFYSANDESICQTQINHPVAKLITLDQNHHLQHPNFKLFNFIKSIENSFSLHCKQSHVFDLVLNDMSKLKFYYPCAEHGTEVLAYMIHSYLQIRMRQFAKISLADQKKN